MLADWRRRLSAGWFQPKALYAPPRRHWMSSRPDLPEVFYEQEFDDFDCPCGAPKLVNEDYEEVNNLGELAWRDENGNLI